MRTFVRFYAIMSNVALQSALHTAPAWGIGVEFDSPILWTLCP